MSIKTNYVWVEIWQYVSRYHVWESKQTHIVAFLKTSLLTQKLIELIALRVVAVEAAEVSTAGPFHS